MAATFRRAPFVRRYPEYLYNSAVIWTEGGTLNAIGFPAYESRLQSAFQQIAKAWQRVAPRQSFAPILLRTTDRETRVAEVHLAYASTPLQSQAIPVPDFIFCHWKEAGIASFSQTIDEIGKSSSVSATLHRVGWRGNMHTNSIRRQLLDVVTTNNGIMDIAHVDVNTSGGDSQYLSLPEQARRWSVLLDLPGRGYSGRTKLLLASQRPVIIVDSGYREFWELDLPTGLDVVRIPAQISAIKAAAVDALDDYQGMSDLAKERSQWIRETITQESAIRRWALVLETIPDTERPHASRLRRLFQGLLRPVAQRSLD